jgi:hypothetical protein
MQATFLKRMLQPLKLNTDKTARYYSESGPANQKVFKNVRGLEAQTSSQKERSFRNTQRILSGL